MDARTLQVLMDINSMQSFGAVNSFSENTQSTPSIFNSMLEEMLGNLPQHNSVSSNSLNASSLLGSTSNTESLRYNGYNEVFKPASLVSLLNASKSTTSPVGAATVDPITSTGSKSTSYNGKYENIIKDAAQKYNLPERLISSVIKHESSFKNNTVSHAGAQGLMQLMPGTAKFLGVTNSFDPAQNINGGAKYLRQMLNQFNGNMELAIAAYNAGPGNVKKYGGIPPFKETQNYVKRVLNTFNS